MVKVITYFEVQDFEKWKSTFIANAGLRKSSGVVNIYAFRDIENPKRVAVISEWDSKEHAEAFSKSQALRAAQQQATIVGAADAYFMQLIK